MSEPRDAEQSVLIDLEPGAEGLARPKRSVDKTFRRYDQDQPMLLAPDLRDWLPGDHPARWVDDLVEYGLDLAPFFDDFVLRPLPAEVPNAEVQLRLRLQSRVVLRPDLRPHPGVRSGPCPRPFLLR